jgi:uncharacterized protein YcfL
MRYAILLCTLLPSALLVVGCSVRPPIEGREDPYKSSQIHFDSDELRRDTAVGTPVVVRDEYGLLHVSVPVRSAIDKQLYVDYRVSFFDQNHMVLDQMSWAHKTLAANTPDQIQFVSADKRAVDFQIDFRYPPGY